MNAKLAAKVVLIATYVLGVAGSVSAEPILIASETKLAEELEAFGHSAAIDGDTVVIGARLDDAGGLNVGAAYVYREVGGAWTFEQKIVPIGAALEGQLGQAVAVDGDTLVVGGAASGVATAYVFVRSAGVWSQQAQLFASDGGVTFGRSVVVRGDVAIVGDAFRHTGGVSDSGAAYVFQRVAGAWSETQILTAAIPVEDGNFGAALDIDGDTLIVGAPTDEFTSRVHVFRESGCVWNEEAVLTSNNPFGGDFGGAVAVSGDLALVSRVAHDHVEAFTRTGTAWSFEAEFTGNSNFGHAISLENDRALISESFALPPGALTRGVVHVFDRNGGTWTAEERLDPFGINASNPNAPTRFGTALALDGGRALATASNCCSSTNAGAAFTFDLTAPPELFAGAKLKIANKSPDDESRNKVQFVSRDGSIPAPFPGSSGDPRCVGAAGGGALLTISSPTSGASTSQPLPCQNWELLGKESQRRGYKYVDKELDDGACKILKLQTEKGIKVTCLGKGPSVLDYDLQLGQSEAPVQIKLELGDGWQYCAEFGGLVLKDGSDAKSYLAKLAPAPAGCS